MESTRDALQPSGQLGVAALRYLPSAAALGWVVAETCGALPGAVAASIPRLPLPVLTLAASVTLFILSRRHGGRRHGLVEASLLVPCFFAPTALLHPWSLAPSHLSGVAWASPATFLRAATEYPDFGPVNIKVMAGACALILVAFLPAISGLLGSARRARIALNSLAVVTLAAYVPVALRLDSDLVLAACLGSGAEPLVFLAYGPASRALGVAAAIALALRARTRLP